jgi:tRNA 2-thiouridine synthesizing protein A
MQTIDVRGQQCPAPLIATRKALKETANGGSFEVVTSSRNALDNISRFLRDNKTEFKVREENNTWTIAVTKNEV